MRQATSERRKSLGQSAKVQNEEVRGRGGGWGGGGGGGEGKEGTEITYSGLSLE